MNIETLEITVSQDSETLVSNINNMSGCSLSVYTNTSALQETNYYFSFFRRLCT